MRSTTAFRISILSSLALLLAAAPASAEITQASITIGGPGSSGSDGYDDPGLLADGQTPASGDLDLTFDDQLGVLTATITNTSPVTAGVCNPPMTDLYFNVPIGIAGMTLVNQSSSGGAIPQYVLTFDADLLSAPNPNGANGFGAFNVALNNPGGISGAIANPDADTLPAPPNSLALSPVTFTFTVSGSFDGLTAQDFVDAFSIIPPGSLPSQAAGKFQGGGTSCDASGFVNNGDGEECYLVIGPSLGSGAFVSPGVSDHEFETNVGGLTGAFGTTMENPPAFPLTATTTSTSPGSSVSVGGAVPAGRDGSSTQGQGFGLVPGQVYSAQVVMWNPVDFPGLPEQSSNTITFSVTNDGRVVSFSSGVSVGIEVSLDTFVGADGVRYLTFPFTIDGL